MPAAGTANRNLAKMEWVTALLIVLWLVILHLMVLQHAGALWRDEVNTVYVAGQSSLGDTLASLHFDSFPALFPLLLNVWIKLGLGSTDTGLRVFAFLPAVGLVGMLWWTVRQFGGRLPLISLVLVGLSPTFFRYASGVRAYSLGVVTLLLAMGLLWRLLQRPTAWRAAWAGLAAVLAVHTTYFNTPMLAALGLAAVVVCLRRRDRKALGLLLGAGATAALSLLPYLAILSQDKEWAYLSQVPVTVLGVFGRLTEAVDTSPLGQPMLWLWLALFVLALGIFGYRLLRPETGPTPDSRDVALFGMIAMVAGILFFYAFLKFIGQATSIWYYLSIMVIVAIFVDVAVQSALAERLIGRWVQVILVLALALWCVPGTGQAARIRWTNVDGVAARLGALAGPDDLVVVNPWFIGATFSRYYQGPAPWTVMPALDTYHYQDLWSFLRATRDRAATRPILEKIGRTLESGHRVWIVGGGAPYASVQAPGDEPPDIVDPAETVGAQYMVFWAHQMAYYLQTHARRLSPVEVPVDDPVSGYEDMPLYCVTGWQAAGAVKP
jgi:hypothetical protein